MTDAPREAGRTHPRARTGAFCPGEGTALPRERPLRLSEKCARRRVSANTERDQFAPNALFGAKAAAHRGGLRATTTVRGEQSR